MLPPTGRGDWCAVRAEVRAKLQRKPPVIALGAIHVLCPGTIMQPAGPSEILNASPPEVLACSLIAWPSFLFLVFLSTVLIQHSSPARNVCVMANSCVRLLSSRGVAQVARLNGSVVDTVYTWL